MSATCHFKSRILFFLIIFFPSFLHAQQSITLSSFEKENPTTFQATFAIAVPPGDAFYADYFSFSVDHPDITLSEWHPSIEPISKYDVSFKGTKKIFVKPFTIALQTHTDNPALTTANLHVGYYQQSQKQNKHAIFPIQLNPPNEQNEEIVIEESFSAAPHQSEDEHITAPSFSSNYLSSVLQTTQSWWVRLLLSLLLGFLLSLTPCIYPMIPITMGILQSQGGSSMRRNFALSLTYTVGIATMFALLGVFAAFTGKMFGSIMNNPLVILSIIALLAYLAGSMLGFYQMYIPRFLQPKNQSAQGGSFLSVFMFGAASGTVASPCLSPGLLLLLTLVTSIGSAALGFALLFAFGLGLGIPLLIIGTFSGSLNMLPQAGTWMIDIKEFFGFIMLATCFYFLSLLMPLYLLSWGIAAFIAGIGIFYIRTAQKAVGTSKRIKNMVGILCIAASVYAFYWAYKTTDMHFNRSEQPDMWIYDFEKGKALALGNNKHMLLEISAPYCSICKAIDTKIFANSKVKQALQKVIAIKIDDIEKDEHTKMVQKQFNILGAPTIILWDPMNKKELKRWGGELYDSTPEEFVRQIDQS